MLLRLTYLAVTNAFAMLRLLPMSDHGEPAADLPRVLDALVLAVRWSADLASPCRQDAARGPPTLREFLVKVPESRRWWETHRVTRCAHGVQHFRHTLVGSLSLQYETLTFLADTGQALRRTQREAGSPSAEALALLASWSAPSSPAPATHT
ncbi:hypothetical protein ACGFXB_39460 [Streptomyces canus]|uniref:MmyB family transcriptional regulator n=1 Tax=Streptomyces canus TaxID=58343 RepID=UPI00372176BB